MFKYFIILLLFSPCVFGEIAFQDDFDDHTDWTSPEQQLNSGSDTSVSDGDSDTACSVCPDGAAKYAGIFNQRAAWSDYRGQPLMKIDATNARSGKALTFWHEPINSSSCDGGTYWCSGGLLSIVLPTTYNELYIQVYIKFQGDWAWDSTNAEEITMKMLRVTNYHTTPGNMYSFGPDANGSHHPVSYFDLYRWTPGGAYVRGKFIPRYNATFYANQATPALSMTQGAEEIIPITGNPAWTDWMGDGDYHRLVMHVKGNSAQGTADGVYGIYLDDVKIYERTDVAWADDTDDQNYWTPTAFPGWNHIVLGGNAYNRVYSAETHTEQWYAIDDVVIAETYGELDGEEPPAATSGNFGAGSFSGGIF